MNIDLKLVLLASGGGSLASEVIKNYGKNVLALISDRDCPAISIAEQYGIDSKVIKFKEEREIWNQELIDAVEIYKPDLVASVGFMRILSSKFIATFPTINTHPAYLPNFPGAHAVRDALAVGAKTTGCTVHWVDEGVDTGKIIDQVEIPIVLGENESQLHERIKIVERKLFVDTIDMLDKDQSWRR